MKEFELEPDEQVIQEARKHWFLFALELLPFAILATIPFALPTLLSFAGPLAEYAGLFTYTSSFSRVGLGVWLLVLWTGAWGAFTRYYLDLWVLTNERIVDIDQRAFFNRKVSSLLLDRVQDITVNVEGVLSSILDIGDIKVQSAGATNEFEMKGIPNPQQMRDLILKYVPESDKPAGL